MQVFIGDNIKIRSDLEACDKDPAKIIDVQLPDQLEDLMQAVPDVEDLPYFESRVVAAVDLRKVRAELIRNPKVKTSQDLIEIAKPFTVDMTLLKPTLKSQLNEYVPIKLSLSLTIIVFFLNLLLHILFIWAYHKFAFILKHMPKFLRKNEYSPIQVKPIIVIDSDANENVLDAISQKFCATHQLYQFDG